MEQAAARKHRQIMLAIWGMTWLVLGLLALVIYMMNNRPLPQYYVVNGETKQLKRLIPLARPIFTRTNIVEWSALAAVAAYTYDAADYQKQLQSAMARYFTPAAGARFMADLAALGSLTEVATKRLTVTAVPQGAPVILKQGYIGDTYSYKIQMPLLVTYQSPSEVSQQRLIVTLLVEAVPTWQFFRGIAISDFWVDKG